MKDTWPLLDAIPFPALTRGRLDTLQVNLGYRCNQSCVHCHVNAGPNRTEEMSADTIDRRARFARAPAHLPRSTSPGGAPELNPHFRRLVVAARDMGVEGDGSPQPHRSRANPEQEDLAEFLADNQVEIVASMPCYLQDNVDQQRGKGVCRRLDPRAAEPQRAGLWPRGFRPHAQPRLQSARPFAAAASSSLRPTTSAFSASASVSCSTACSRSPTCRFNASARSCCRKANSTPISTRSRMRIATRTLMA